MYIPIYLYIKRIVIIYNEYSYNISTSYIDVFNLNEHNTRVLRVSTIYVK